MITYSLRVPTIKLRCLAADMLAAMCVISDLGHQLVLDGFSDSKIVLGETFRFELLISSLGAFSKQDEEVELEEERLMWEWRTAALGLINALSASEIDLELRCDLGGEMRRRGFDHAVDVSRHPRTVDKRELMIRDCWTWNPPTPLWCKLKSTLKTGTRTCWSGGN